MSDTPYWSTTAPLPAGLLPISPSPLSEEHDALKPGSHLDEFEIIRVLGVGGFGIVYLALDQVLLRYVAIKEYLPTALAARVKNSMVSVRSSSHFETFAVGLESFFNEARMLASFDHPSLVKVHRFWKANGTAYMAMQYYPGQTLKDARRDMSALPNEAWLRSVVDPLLGALDALHGQAVFHRDIAPDNILLLPDGRPVLLDFGSARRVIGDLTQSLTAILKPNFAPIEQYADEAGMRQGAWTDLYALGATVHFMITGQTPTPAVMRAVRDVMPALSVGGAKHPGLSREFLAAIDWTLALAPAERPQSVATMRQALSGEIVPPPPSPRHSSARPAQLANDGATLPAGPRYDPTRIEPREERTIVLSTVSGYAPTRIEPREQRTIAVGPPASSRSESDSSLASSGSSAHSPSLPQGSSASASSASSDDSSDSLSTGALVRETSIASPALSTAADSARPVSKIRLAALALGLIAFCWAAVSITGAPRSIEPSRAVALAAARSGDTDTPRSTSSPAARDSNTTTTASTTGLTAASAPRSGSSDASTVTAEPRVPHPRARAIAEAMERRAAAAQKSAINGTANDRAAEVATAAAAPVESARRPNEICASLNFFARAACFRRECQSPQWRTLPQCVEARSVQEAQQQRGQL
jgi:serine/threonine protein kinase